MKAKELHEMTTAELEAKANQLKTELFNLRFQMATSQLQNPMAIQKCKRDYARVKTILREREIKASSTGM